MKSLLIAFTMLFILTAKSSYANEEKIAEIILQSFKSSFNDAKNVTWSRVEGLYKAVFVLDGQTLSVWYNPEGNLIALSRKLNPTQLPISLQTSLKKRSEGYTLTDLFEIDNDAGTLYYAELENTNKRIMLESTSRGEWSVYKRSRIK
jgi:hypothetical protein